METARFPPCCAVQEGLVGCEPFTGRGPTALPSHQGHDSVGLVWVQAECRRLLQELLRAPQLQASTISAAYQSSGSRCPRSALAHCIFRTDGNHVRCLLEWSTPTRRLCLLCAGTGWLRGTSDGAGSLPTSSGAHTFSFDVQACISILASQQRAQRTTVHCLECSSCSRASTLLCVKSPRALRGEFWCMSCRWRAWRHSRCWTGCRAWRPCGPLRRWHSKRWGGRQVAPIWRLPSTAQSSRCVPAHTAHFLCSSESLVAVHFLYSHAVLQLLLLSRRVTTHWLEARFAYARRTTPPSSPELCRPQRHVQCCRPPWFSCMCA